MRLDQGVRYRAAPAQMSEPKTVMAINKDPL